MQKYTTTSVPVKRPRVSRKRRTAWDTPKINAPHRPVPRRTTLCFESTTWLQCPRLRCFENTSAVTVSSRRHRPLQLISTTKLAVEDFGLQCPHAIIVHCNFDGAFYLRFNRRCYSVLTPSSSTATAPDAHDGARSARPIGSLRRSEPYFVRTQSARRGTSFGADLALDDALGYLRSVTFEHGDAVGAGCTTFGNIIKVIYHLASIAAVLIRWFYCGFQFSPDVIAHGCQATHSQHVRRQSCPGGRAPG